MFSVDLVFSSLLQLVLTIYYTVRVLIERHSKSASNSLYSLKTFPIMCHHLRVVFLIMHHNLI